MMAHLRPRVRSPRPLRLVTWNVNSLRVRLPRVLELLAEYRPDVVCLQETKTAPDAFPVAALAGAGYGAVHDSGGRWAGVALLARAGMELSDPVIGLAGDPVPSEARWCEATVGGIRIASVYVPHGRALDSPEFPRKLAFLDAAARRVSQLQDTPLILAGDFNIAPSDADVYDAAAFAGATHVTAQERAKLAAIEDHGLADAYRTLHPTEVQYTWWDYRSGNFHKGLGMRIDLALVSGGLADRLRACGIDREYRKGTKPSDHAPLLLDLAGASH
jgi:exodeoxyribonuclease-3